jgi:large conductance mechanosensitive channel
MSIFQEFKQFASRGNVVDLAVGLVMGAGFGKIVTALVDNIIMPPVGYILGGVDFKDLKLVIKAADPATHSPGVMIGYGNFIQTVVDFTIIAFAMFLLVKAVNTLKRTTPPPPAAPTPDQVLLSEIRDLLKAKS